MVIVVIMVIGIVIGIVIVVVMQNCRTSYRPVLFRLPIPKYPSFYCQKRGRVSRHTIAKHSYRSYCLL